MAAPTAYGRPQARDQIQATAAIYATDAATLDSFNPLRWAKDWTCTSAVTLAVGFLTHYTIVGTSWVIF